MIIKNKAIFLFCIILGTLFLCGCSDNSNTSVPTLNIVFHSPSTDSSSVTIAPGTATQVNTQSPTAVTTQYTETTPSPTPSPTPVQTATATPTATPAATPIPTGDIVLPADYEEATGDKSKYTDRAPMKQVTYTVHDPLNTRKLSTARVGHYFGLNTSVPIKFQNTYNAKGWSALTIDTKTTEKVIYLTFDCGYENGHTGRILDTLKEKNCTAAFFITLPYAASNSALTARMINEGHIVGNHSTTHPDFSKITREKMAREVQKLENYLRVNFGYYSPYFRYPTGAYNDSSMELLTSMGYRSIFWSYAYVDYESDNFPGKDAAFRYVTNRLHPGEVLLLHAISPGNADALGDIIDYVRAQGYEFRTLDQYPW